MGWRNLSLFRENMAEPYTLKDFIDDYMRDHPEIDSYNKFAQAIGASASTVSDIVKGKYRPGIELLGKIAEATSTDFLLLVQITYPEHVSPARLSPTAQLLAEQINRLPNPLRQILIRFIRSLPDEE